MKIVFVLGACHFAALPSMETPDSHTVTGRPCGRTCEFAQTSMPTSNGPLASTQSLSLSLSLSEGITQFLLPTCSPHLYSSHPSAVYNGLFVASVAHIRASLHVITQNGHRTLRLTLHEQNQHQTPTTDKPIGRAFALVQPTYERQPLKSDLVKQSEDQGEVIKVYLEDRKEAQARHQQSLKMLSEEVTQIQEVRYCLKNLREQMAAKSHRTEHKDSMDEQEKEKMREASKRLYSQLQEAEKKHQEEREKLLSEYLRKVQQSKEQQDQQIEDLRRLMGGMEQESSTLREQLMTKEAELLQLRELREEAPAGRERLEELEKENAILKEKIHHLDDMLKSQQRKLRQMIEQNKQMRDQMDYYLGSQRSNSYLPLDTNAQIVYSKPLRPSTQTNKSLPFIKVIEIKS
ncbi:Tuftelin [Labeo rohita]|uniref:Tuftelin n=1 Tax=Labeo rohita TaxID=84645 RepID=A0ABQ8LXE1_LABRO|nr:Tuftelin [Labeo rohita]